MDQITAASRPVKPPKKGLQGILSSKYLKWGGIVVALFLVILLFGSMLSGKPSIEEECIELKLHLDGTTELITDFQPDVKSLSLRSLSSSLKGLFSNISSQINSYLIKAYDFNDKHIKETTMQEAEDNKNRLGNELFDAKINVYELLGAEVFLYFDLADFPMTARVDPRTTARPGDTVKFAIDVEKIHVFDKETTHTITN